MNQFPILRPIVVVTEPYLNVFRRTIPPIAGFDLSVLPAVFLLDVLSQTTAAIGSDFPPNFDHSISFLGTSHKKKGSRAKRTVARV